MALAGGAVGSAADRVTGDSLYSRALERMGEKIRRGVVLSVLQGVEVAECHDRAPVVLGEDTSFRTIPDELRASGQLDFIPVVEENGEGEEVWLAGLPRRAEIMETCAAHLMLPD